MNVEIPEYVSLDCLAARLRLPKSYLRELGLSGKIPVLRAGTRMCFCIDDVREALRHLAASRDAEETSCRPVFLAGAVNG